jgi:hypothetical protein
LRLKYGAASAFVTLSALGHLLQHLAAAADRAGFDAVNEKASFPAISSTNQNLDREGRDSP